MRKTKKTIIIILEELEKTGLISSACAKAKIPRSTFYRWYNGDLELRMRADKAIDAGRSNMVDFAESRLIKNIQDGSQRATEFYLKHNENRYRHPSLKEFNQQMEVIREKYQGEFDTLAFTRSALFNALPAEVLFQFALGDRPAKEERGIDYRKLNEQEIKIEAERITGSDIYKNLAKMLMDTEGLSIGDIERMSMPKKQEIKYDDKSA